MSMFVEPRHGWVMRLLLWLLRRGRGQPPVVH